MNTVMIRMYAGIALLSCTAAWGGSVNGLTTFVPNTNISASAMNANFAIVDLAVDDNDSRVTAIESVVTGGNLILAPSTAATGNIRKGSNRFLHNYGTFNTFLGINSGNYSLSGSDNTGIGRFALTALTSGSGNTGLGSSALQGTTIGYNNTAAGFDAMVSNTAGHGNTAIGAGVLSGNTTGNDNTALGASAMQSNISGNSNTAIGLGALRMNTTGFENTAIGVSALANTTSGANTAVGTYALAANTSGTFNTAIGHSALLRSTGLGNIGLGDNGGANLTFGWNNIAIGNAGVAGEGETIRIGSGQSRTFIAGIRGVTTGVANAVPVYIDSNGQLGTIVSSRYAKDDIADMGNASQVLMQLRPVTFHYKADSARPRALQFGLVAEEVARIAPELVVLTPKGRIETVQYQFLAPMLLNEYQKQQHRLEAQARRLSELEQQVQEVVALKQELSALRAAIRMHDPLATLSSPVHMAFGSNNPRFPIRQGEQR